MLLDGDWEGMSAWLVGALFIPALALTLGCWSGSSKLFEVVYTMLWYCGPVEGLAVLDFMGASAPAFGMIGTLIGLVQMLANL